MFAGMAVTLCVFLSSLLTILWIASAIIGRYRQYKTGLDWKRVYMAHSIQLERYRYEGADLKYLIADWYQHINESPDLQKIDYVISMTRPSVQDAWSWLKHYRRLKSSLSVKQMVDLLQGHPGYAIFDYERKSSTI